MERLVKLVAFFTMSAATALPALAGDELKPRDLSPVKWMDAPDHPPVEIVREGRARVVVLVADPDPSAKLQRLVDELFEGVRLSTGATLQRVTEAPSADQPAIVIGDCEASRKAGIDAGKIPIEGFVIKTATNRVYLVGSTKTVPPGSDRHAHWSNEGTAWAVADFLERLIGVRWYWPTELGGRCITRSASLVIPPVHYSDQPVFRLREYHPPGGWAVPRRLFPVVFTPNVVQRMKTLRNKALAEMDDHPVARQRFLYWTWTFDAFLKEAEEISRKKTR